MLRFARYRLKTEWLRFLLGVAFAAAFLIWSGFFMTPQAGNLAQFVAKYDGVDPEQMAIALGIDVSELKPTLEENFRMMAGQYRGLRYYNLVDGTEWLAGLPLSIALSVLFLTGPLRNKRLDPLLAAGYGRFRIFLSLTLVYYAAVVLTWFVSAKVLLALYSVRWTPEEADFFRTTRLAWLLTFLFRASILYLLSFLLGSPLPAALTGIGISFLLRWLKSAVPAIPIRIVPPGPYPNGPTWDPGADLSAVVKGNWIALGVCILSVLIAWLCFRKRSLE